MLRKQQVTVFSFPCLLLFYFVSKCHRNWNKRSKRKLIAIGYPVLCLVLCCYLFLISRHRNANWQMPKSNSCKLDPEAKEKEREKVEEEFSLFVSCTLSFTLHLLKLHIVFALSALFHLFTSLLQLNCTYCVSQVVKVTLLLRQTLFLAYGSKVNWSLV